MHRTWKTALFALGIVSLMTLVAGQSTAAQGAAPGSPRAIVEGRNKGMSAAVAKKDAAGVAAFYVEDADFFQSTPSGSDHMHGRDDILKIWQSLVDRGVIAFELTTSDATLATGTITEKGKFLMKTADGTVISQGTYESQWTNAGGQWRIKRNSVVLAK